MLSEWKNLSKTKWTTQWRAQFEKQTTSMESAMICVSSDENLKTKEVMDIICRTEVMKQKSPIICFPASLTTKTNTQQQMKQMQDENNEFIDWNRLETINDTERAVKLAFDKLCSMNIIILGNNENEWVFDHMYYNSLVIRIIEQYPTLVGVWNTIKNNIPVKTLQTNTAAKEDKEEIFQDWFKIALMPLSIFGWPVQTKDYKSYYPFNYYVFDITQVEQVQQMLVISYALSGHFPFKTLVLTDSTKQYQLTNTIFSNKIWNLAKFILQLPQFRLDFSSVTIDAPIIETNEFKKKRTNVYTKRFLLEARDIFTDLPIEGIPDIIVNVSQRPVSSKWKSKRNSNHGGSNPLMMEEKLRTFRGCLNKSTPDNIDRIIPKLLPLFTVDIFEKVVELIYSKMVMEPDFQQMYAKLCQAFYNEFPQFSIEFYKIYKEECIKEFTSSYTSEALQWKAHKKIMGTVEFMAHLVNIHLFKENICLDILQVFIERPDINHLSIELTCTFIKTLDTRNDIVPLEYVNILKEFKSISSNPPRLRFMVEDTLELFTKQDLKGLAELKIQYSNNTHCSDDNNAINVHSNVKFSDVRKDNENNGGASNNGGSEFVIGIGITGNPDYAIHWKNCTEMFHFCSNYWITQCLLKTIQNVNEFYQNRDIESASNCIQTFIYNDFCDIYLEAIKPVLYQTTEDILRIETFKTLEYVLKTILPLLHPYLPLLSEEFYIQLPQRNAAAAGIVGTDNNDVAIAVDVTALDSDDNINSTSTLLICEYPMMTNLTETIDNNIINQFKIVSELIQEIKKERICFKLARKQTISIIIICNTKESEIIYKKFNDMIRALCWCHDITIKTYDNPSDSSQLVHPLQSKFTYSKIGDVTIYYDWSTLDRKHILRLRNKYQTESQEFQRINTLCLTCNNNNTNNGGNNNNGNNGNGNKSKPSQNQSTRSGGVTNKSRNGPRSRTHSQGNQSGQSGQGNQSGQSGQGNQSGQSSQSGSHHNRNNAITNGGGGGGSGGNRVNNQNPDNGASKYNGNTNNRTPTPQGVNGSAKTYKYNNSNRVVRNESVVRNEHPPRRDLNEQEGNVFTKNDTKKKRYNHNK
jgi:hypothetical protein